MANSFTSKKASQSFGQSALKYPEGWKFEIMATPKTRSPFADQAVERDPFYAEVTFTDAATGKPHVISKSITELNSIVTNLETKMNEGHHVFDGRARLFFDARDSLKRKLDTVQHKPQPTIKATMPSMQ